MDLGVHTPFADEDPRTSRSSPSGGVDLAIGIAASVIVFAAIMVLIYYLCVHAAASRRRGVGDDGSNGSKDVEKGGVDEATLKSWPRMTYAEVKSRCQPESSCAVCLSEYEDKEELWRLPECEHQFHVRCLESWLRRQATCPLCRSPCGLPP